MLSTTYIVATVFLFCVSLLPPAYLRYYPFRPIASKHQQRILLMGHLGIFFLEFIILSVLFGTRYMSFATGTFQTIYLFIYWPYVLLLMFTIRPFWFRHIFVLGLQSIYMLFVHTVTMEIFKLSWPELWYYEKWLPYFALYLFLFLIGMPFMLHIFGKLFTKEQLLQPKMAFWNYLGPVPLLLTYYHANMGYFNLDPQMMLLPSIHLYTLVSRGMLVLVGIFLILAVQSGFQQIKLIMWTKERTVKMQEQLEDINVYATALREEQQQLAILRHDSRHQLRLLAELVESGHYEDAEKHLLMMRKEVEKRECHK
ncbi:MAG: GHKL domain-containing protein [Mitsuokella multacida]|uniref:hypothetical protein n=1 Tax=Mitsuokella sp. TaxID=2049034 RepID=UPI003D4BF407